MDYNEWLLDVYTLKMGPFTSSDSFKSFIGLVAAGALITTFSSIIIGFYQTWFLGDIMPLVSEYYTDLFYDPTDAFIEDTMVPFLESYGLNSSAKNLDLNWETFNYFVIDVFFAYLSGDLTSDPDYA
jgi:hypothetical protein